MALPGPTARAPVCLLLVFLYLRTVTGMSGWGGCLDGQNVSAAIKENTVWGEIVAELMADTTMEGVQWSLIGKDAHWFFLDGSNIRLNTSADRVLDREALGPILIAELTCHEDGILLSVYSVLVKILNENDNSPVFAENTVRALVISELTAVNTVVFTVQATDADNDNIIYSIDQASPDAEYFKIDLPNSGEVVLSKPLDYETKTVLTVTIYASEMNTAEHYNISTSITITVQDGDDQYPQFLPCTWLFQEETNQICTSPVYTVNVTEGEEDILLDFSPGPIHAVDGDSGLNSSLSYAILSGDHDEHFTMDRLTGEMRLTRGVRDRLITPLLRLQVMAYQDNDPRKYSVATVLVRVLAANQFSPEFDKPEYRGFVVAGKSPASLVDTYGSKALVLHVHDQDFNQGFNPMIYFTFNPTSNHTDIYQVTQEGLLIAKTSELKPEQEYVLEVMAVDQESGDATFATVVVEVLPEGQPIPYGPLRGDHVIGCTVGKALFLSMVFMTALGCVLSILMWLKKKQKGKRGPLERGCVAQGKHPNVSLRWFQLMSHHNTMPQMEEVPYSSEEYGTYNPSFSFTENPGIYTQQGCTPCQEPTPPTDTAVPDTSSIPTETVTFNNNVSTPTNISCISPTFTAPANVSPTDKTQGAAPPNEAPGIPPELNPESIEEQSNISPSPETHDADTTPPVTCPDMQTGSNDDLVDPTTSPSSQSSIPFSRTRIASAEIDKPFRKSRVKTPSYSPLLSTSIPRQTSTPPPTPEDVPLKATLVHIDTSPTETPPETPERTAVALSTEVYQPSTSLDEIESERLDGTADSSSHPEERRASTHSGNTQDDRRVGEDDDGFLGDEDADKNSEGELESDEEELLRVMARCNPIFITFSK
ncbi:cadherin-related family member 5 isoform X3 [Pelmatolapia mariae]